MELYSPSDLAQAFEASQPPAVIDITGPAAFDQAHLPYAVNVPAGPGFVERVRAHVPETETKVVLSAPPGSTLLEPSAAALEAAGYRKVVGYKGVVNAWRPDLATRATVDAAANVDSVVGGPRMVPPTPTEAPADRDLFDRAKDFATKRLLKRFVPGWNIFAVTQDLSEALRRTRSRAPRRERRLAWGTVGAAMISATNVPVIAQMGAVGSAALEWARDRAAADDG